MEYKRQLERVKHGLEYQEQLGRVEKHGLCHKRSSSREGAVETQSVEEQQERGEGEARPGVTQAV